MQTTPKLSQTQTLKRVVHSVSNKIDTSKPLKEQIAERLLSEKFERSNESVKTTDRPKRKKKVPRSPVSKEEQALKQNIKHGSIKLYQTMRLRGSS